MFREVGTIKGLILIAEYYLQSSHYLHRAYAAGVRAAQSDNDYCRIHVMYQKFNPGYKLVLHKDGDYCYKRVVILNLSGYANLLFSKYEYIPLDGVPVYHYVHAGDIVYMEGDSLDRYYHGIPHMPVERLLSGITNNGR